MPTIDTASLGQKTPSPSQSADESKSSSGSITSMTPKSSTFTPSSVNLDDSFDNLTIEESCPAYSFTANKEDFVTYKGGNNGSGADDTPTPSKHRILHLTQGQVLEALAVQTLEKPFPEVFQDLAPRQHGGKLFGSSRPNGEAISTFIFASSKKAILSDWYSGGKYYNILLGCEFTESCILPPGSDPYGGVAVVARFNNVTDATDAINFLRAAGNVLNTGFVTLDMRVFAIHAISYCKLASRRFHGFGDKGVPTLTTLAKTFAGGYDGQIIIQCRPTTANHTQLGSVSGDWISATTAVVVNRMSEYAKIFHINILLNDWRRPIIAIHIEFHEPGRADLAVDWSLFNPYGILEGDFVMWITHYTPDLFTPTQVCCNIADEETEDPVNAFRRRWVGDCQCAFPEDSPRSFRSDGENYLRFQQSKNNIDVNRIYTGTDVRTTVMFRNIPAEMTTHAFEQWVRFFARGHFDFLYLRKDFQTGKNVGYAFVNLMAPVTILTFVTRAVGTLWPGTNKRVDLSYAQIQGKDALIQKFRNSVVMEEADDARPRIYYMQPHNMAGLRDVFPRANNLMKQHRSRQNADEVGLFAANRRGYRGRAGYYDRGNPRGGAFGHVEPGVMLRLQRENLQLRRELDGRDMQ